MNVMSLVEMLRRLNASPPMLGTDETLGLAVTDSVAASRNRMRLVTSVIRFFSNTVFAMAERNSC